jgi:hypothetical protein
MTGPGILVSSLTLPVFGDSAEPANIPTEYAMLYGDDCEYPAPPAQRARFAGGKAHYITFAGDRRHLIADFEPGTEVWADISRLRTWHQVRTAYHHRCVVYCSRSNVARAARALGGPAACLWHIATLDGIPRTATQLAAELAAYGVPNMPAANIWAQQVETVRDRQGNPLWDRDNLLGAWT